MESHRAILGKRYQRMAGRRDEYWLFWDAALPA
jgi:hypothetical protein